MPIFVLNRSKDARSTGSNESAPHESNQAAVPASSKPASRPPSSSLAVLRSASSWNVRMPPIKKHMVAGRLVSTVRTAVRFFAQRRRHIRLEIRGPPLSARELKDTLEDTLRDDDVVLLRIFYYAKGDASSDDDEEPDEGASVVSAHSLSTLQGEHQHDSQHLKEHRRYRLEDVHILKTSGKICEVRLGSGHEVIVRDIKFETDEQAKSFHEIWERMGRLERERAQRQIVRYKNKLQQSKPGTPPSVLSRSLFGGSEGELHSIDLLVEIVGATNLPIADIYSTDAYVIVRMGGKEVHRTKTISKDVDPIWTLENGSLFLLQMTPEEFFACTGGMTFVLKDYDSLGSNEILGSVNVSLDQLLVGEGERTEFLIETDKKLASSVKHKNEASKLSLRFKKASDSDKDFLNAYKNNEKKLGVYLGETFMPVRAPYSKILHGQRKKGPNGEPLFRTKPFPDPTREEDTKWMTEEDIEAESSKESTYWVEAGSGDLGKVFIEIIGCDNLPNMDKTTLNVRDKTDAFACIMFEDSIVNTDVITDSLSPRWVPWCRRAFAFNIAHPASDLLLALFDHDPEISPAQFLARAVSSDHHDRIGRIRINLSRFLPSTSYDLSYPLFYGELDEYRKKTRGTVHIRLRLEWDSIKSALVAAMLPPEPSYVSVANKLDYRVAHYTADGIVDEKKFSMSLFTKYIEELESYDVVVDYLVKAALVVWLWRGHYELKIGSKTVYLPLHSVVAYCWAILVTWDFNLLPSFLLFCIGWALLATNEQRKRIPSRWRQSPGYFELLRAFLLGYVSSETIPSNDRLSEIIEYDEHAMVANEKRKLRKEEEAKQEEELAKEYQDQIDEAEGDDVDITSTGKGSVTVNPLKPILYPIQKELQKAVTLVRISKTIILWEKAFYAFWLVTLAFVASAAVLFVPWAFLLRWTLRISAWVLLGPWMTIVDRVYIRKVIETSDDDDTEAIKARLKQRYTDVLESATHARIRKERALKLKAMKRFCFGKFLLKIPHFNEDLFWDSPLPQSSARPDSSENRESIDIVEKKYGQSLKGDMIPQREIQLAETKKAATERKKKRFWKKNFLRRRKKTPNESSETTPLLDATVSVKEDESEYQTISEETV